jgi:integrase
LTRTTKHISWDELSNLIAGMRKDGNRLHLLCTIQGLLGLRIGDVLSLRWEDLLSNTELSKTEQKTKKMRVMGVTEQLRKLVLTEYEGKFGIKKKDLIFINKHNTGSISISYVNRMLKKAFIKYNIDADQVSSHIFRKSFAYKILEEHDFSDKGIFLVSRLLNHSNINTTMTYLQLDKKEELEAYESLKL